MHLEVFKDTHDRGDKVGTFEFRVDHPEEEHDIPSKDFFFDFEGEVEITDGEYKVDGGANAGFDDKMVKKLLHYYQLNLKYLKTLQRHILLGKIYHLILKML